MDEGTKTDPVGTCRRVCPSEVTAPALGPALAGRAPSCPHTWGQGAGQAFCPQESLQTTRPMTYDLTRPLREN